MFMAGEEDKQMRNIERKKRVTELVVFIERIVITGLVLLLIVTVIDSDKADSSAAATYVILPEGKGDVSEDADAVSETDETSAYVEEIVAEDHEEPVVTETEIKQEAEEKQQNDTVAPVSNEKYVEIKTPDNETYIEVKPLSNNKQVEIAPVGGNGNQVVISPIDNDNGNQVIVTPIGDDNGNQVTITPIGDDNGNQVDITPIGGGNGNQVVITQ